MKNHMTLVLIAILLLVGLYLGHYKISMTIGLIKSILIGFQFMELNHAHRMWKVLFTISISLPILVILLIT